MVDLTAEQEIIERARLDPSNFGPIFDAYYSAIFSYSLRRVANQAIAQDITAETFYKALTNIHKFKWQGISISHWLYRIATNELRMYFRKNKYQSHSLNLMSERVGFELIDEQNLANEVDELQTRLERNQEFLRAQKLLVTLPVKYQEVIALRFAENKKLSEIANILEKKEGTVKSLLSRGLRMLRQQMDQPEVQPSTGNRIVIDATTREYLTSEAKGIL
jgi:RNA polymerase sigma-70 factor (ECF subfamily)